MGRPRRGIGAELFALALIVGCLAATTAAVISVHRRPAPRAAKAPAVIVLAPPARAAESGPKPIPPPPPPPAPPPVDPTPKILAELATAADEQRAEAEKATQRIAALETAARSARAESDRWKRNLALTRAQLDAREVEANRIEGQADMVAFERDALAKRRDTIKETLERDRERPGYAVLPHRGPHGTWQRPIVLECGGEGVTLRPGGRSFGLEEIVLPLGPGGGPFAMAVAREALRVQRQVAPDGGEIVPYIFFIVRPDGVRSYYEARTRLERVGIAFGYELADADWKIDVPDLDNPATWDGSPPPLNPNANLAAESTVPRGVGTGSLDGKGDGDNPFIWPKTPRGTGERAGQGGIAGLATPGTGDLPSARRRGGPGFGDGLGADGREGPGGSIGGDLDAAEPPTRGGSPRGGLGDGPSPSGGNEPRAGGGGEDAWGRLGRPYDPSKPAGLAAPDGVGTGMGGDMTGDPRRGGRPGGAFGTGRDGGSRPSEDRPGLIGEGNRPGGGSTGTGRGGIGAGGSQGGGTPGRPGGGEPGEGAGGSAGGSASGLAGIPGGGSAGGASGSDLGESGGGNGPRSPLGGFGRTPRPVELVLACGPKGVAVYPGDYRVTKATLKAKDELLAAQLRAIVRRREGADPDHPLWPSIRYVIEPGGRETYATARAQVALSGIDWPSSTQAAGGDTLRLFSTDDW